MAQYRRAVVDKDFKRQGYSHTRVSNVMPWGCVSHGIPQASAMHELLADDDLQVIGLHAVFEHHDVMTVDALKVFIHEYRLTFPIAVDQPSDDQPVPKTMEAYRLRGTALKF